MSADSGLVPRLPMAARPVSRPATAPARAAATSLRPCGSPIPSSEEAHSPATTANVPWAKFTTPVTRWMTTRPLAMSAMAQPTARPLSR